MSTITWSAQQLAIFEWFRNPQQTNLVVVARAGTGKTTTIIEAIKHAPEQKILLCAFNKRIEQELTARLSGTNAQAKTLHALGLSVVRRFWDKVGIVSDGSRERSLTDAVCGSRVPDSVKKLVSKLHSKGRETTPHASAVGDLTALQEQFEIEASAEDQDLGFDDLFIEEKALAAMALAAAEKPLNGIDFADMIFLPCRNGWLRPSFDLVVVDEAQDMNAAQLEIAQGVCKGRIAIVGDDRQAIYGFRGADSGSLGRLTVELKAEVLSLNVTYRCGRKIVEAAQQFVPDFTCGDGAHDGLISNVPANGLQDAAQPGDFVLSRLNAPLVSIAMQLLRNGKRARIAGRDIGANLKSIIRKFRARSVPELLTKISSWETKECKRIIASKKSEAATEARLDAVRDQAAMLGSLAHDAKNVFEVESKIDALFTDDGLGQAGVVTCSSVHKSKGLEASRVFVLKHTLRSGGEEDNIAYVAITRAKHELTWVLGEV